VEGFYTVKRLDLRSSATFFPLSLQVHFAAISRWKKKKKKKEESFGGTQFGVSVRPMVKAILGSFSPLLSRFSCSIKLYEHFKKVFFL
jgi:hypothetical protein